MKIQDILEQDNADVSNSREQWREQRQHVRDAINHLNMVLANNYDRGPRYETPDHDTLVRLARAADMLDNVGHVLAAGTTDDKQILN